MRLFTILSFVATALAGGRTSPPEGALVVSKTQVKAKQNYYSTIQEACNALKTTVTTEQSIFIEEGTYTEQVKVPELKGLLSIYGYTSDTTSYTSNKVTITSSLFASNGANMYDEASATLQVQTSSFKLYNVNVVNSHGKGAQAVACSASKGSQGYYGCSFKGNQNTLLAQTGKQLYAGCYIEGTQDTVYGQGASAWFDQCTIGMLPTTDGAIVASGRASDDSSYYVFNKATIQAVSGQTVKTGSCYLGRPLGAYARVAFQFSSMTNIINSAGWHDYSQSDPRTEHCSFGEYENTGAGSSGTRAKFSLKLKAAVNISAILGDNYASLDFVDKAYLSVS